ncbi:transporter [Thermus scotoductus]|uniref:Transporter n=3 Tax=Thermus scotoductus TaxID=37636 RepID=A0A348XRQ2_THESC|nr:MULTISPECIES: AEC family transporter [Thermus]RTG91986.1 transporter [Thermus scotoductus]RTG93252.1 transporter [Thermus scotoductus]RTG94594.1 transporter [Thermus scotoductus]RTG98646.1 transporter [Thermus scotoductus]RTH00968.1 transporter [Thermus scotoductus]
MPHMQALLNTVLPVALVVFSGYLMGKRIPMDLTTLSRLTLYLLVPALIFDAMYRAEYSREGLVGLALGFTLTYLLLFLAITGMARLLGLSPEAAKSLLVCSLFPNSGNMGLSLVYFALGEEGLRRAVVYFILSSVVMFGLGPAFIRGGGLKEGLLFTLRLPLFYALLLGLLLKTLGVSLPFRLDEGLRLMGQAAIPVLLLTLGMQMSQTRFQVGAFEGVASSLRLLVAPLLAYGVGFILGLPRLEHQVLVLQSATPVAVNAFLLTREFGGEALRVARSVVVSTFLAFLTIPLFLLLIGVR